MINANRPQMTVHGRLPTTFNINLYFLWLVVKKRRFMNPAKRSCNKKAPLVRGFQ